ncbi:MAG: P-II family nitrogen regulator [Firmicutes bacterium]|uniref:P-II family nitrogen regulator n=1 Tax=Candidatus Onthovivens merdipullorum TaxID=2840889 RepID=A0A9D9DN35_9BACL|nr:P-II family nitrogen regulator [Candidatus Onthovivens merdipullorum]
MENEEIKYSLIIAIVNNGNTDLVMEGARNAGARGGTTLHARGTGNIDLEKFYGVPIQNEKEIVLIIVNNEICEKVMNSIYKAAGLETPGQGIVFSQPLEKVYGLSPVTIKEEDEGEDK